jgi:hypothetical protein
MLKILKKSIKYFIEVELTPEEEELLESISSSYDMTLSEDMNFLVKRKRHHRKHCLDKGFRLLEIKRNVKIF